MRKTYIFQAKPVYTGKKKSISAHYGLIFLKDLERLNLQHRTFDWTSPASANHNEIMIQLIGKHWTYAKSDGAFAAYPIDPEDVTPEKLTGVITRWFIGTPEAVMKSKTVDDLDKQKLSQKKGRWRAKLASHHTESIRSLVGESSPCVEPFNLSRCHSDTEDYPGGRQGRLKLRWRSATFTSLCELADNRSIQRIRQESGRHFSAGQLFETKRRPTDKIEENAMVPMNLPLDCYDEGYLNSLSKQARRELTTKAPCGLAEAYFKIKRQQAT
ncbi:hypothetical protein VP01_544g10 [Puccinia sorghi]|uniref:Uncharacterized protein n=1 Tax=Puccinia sorghi TaxID=27349 RepID=A0A0L6UKD0_9BASI|nr:hypothetical protein VP01_544g10 [Puccinia sorghi]